MMRIMKGARGVFEGKTLSEFIAGHGRRTPFRLRWGSEDGAVAIGQILTLLRKGAHLTQSQVAERIGVSQPVVGRMESGALGRVPTFDSIGRYAEACGHDLILEFVHKEARDEQPSTATGRSDP